MDRGALIETRCRHRGKGRGEIRGKDKGREASRDPWQQQAQDYIQSDAFYFPNVLLSWTEGRESKELGKHGVEVVATGWSNYGKYRCCHVTVLSDCAHPEFNPWFSLAALHIISAFVNFPRKLFCILFQEAIIAFPPLGIECGIVSGVLANSLPHSSNELIENNAANWRSLIVFEG